MTEKIQKVLVNPLVIDELNANPIIIRKSYSRYRYENGGKMEQIGYKADIVVLDGNLAGERFRVNLEEEPEENVKMNLRVEKASPYARVYQKKDGVFDAFLETSLYGSVKKIK